MTPLRLLILAGAFLALLTVLALIPSSSCQPVGVIAAMTGCK